MYGLILVEPKEGLPPVDREYYVMQSEFYTAGKFGEEGLQPFDQDKAEDERPSYVVFNGAVGALTGDKSITAKPGETVRLYVGNGGPNLSSSFHVIGEIFDTVYTEAGTKPTHHVQTTVVPPGGAAIVDFKVEVPGTYVLVDHSLFRAFNKGAIGMLKVDGPANTVIYTGKEADTVYVGKEIKQSPTLPPARTAIGAAENKTGSVVELAKDSPHLKGKAVYMQTCFVCHQADGKGIPDQIPPLAKSDFLMADKERSIRGVLQGQSGPMTVNGKNYNGTMIPLNYLTDEQVANVLTYVRNSMGNSGDAVTVEEVARIRKESPAPASIAAQFE
jgi:nitrite reductase (NO-forming)